MSTTTTNPQTKTPTPISKLTTQTHNHNHNHNHNHPKTKPTTPPPTKSIRALYNSETITLYQAYSASIAIPAVETQTLSSSPSFKKRTTWLKPSWTWMLYRSGYSHKDANQAHILALELRHEDFAHLLSRSRIAGEERGRGEVVVQWDPERSVRIGRLDGERSLQVGVPAGLVGWFVERIVRITDVTGVARELKRVIDQEGAEGDDEGKRTRKQGGRKRLEREDFEAMGLCPVERVYDHMLGREIRERLQMRVDLEGDDEGEGVRLGEREDRLGL